MAFYHFLEHRIAFDYEDILVQYLILSNAKKSHESMKKIIYTGNRKIAKLCGVIIVLS